jgi:adenylate cyclase
MNPRFCNLCEQASREFPGGAEVEMSMLFADIRGSTALSEKMSPTEFSQLINRFYTESTKSIADEDGLVEKLAGDSVAAFWGAGFAGPNYVGRTVKVAQNLLRPHGTTEDPGWDWRSFRCRLFWRGGHSGWPDRYICFRR